MKNIYRLISIFMILILVSTGIGMAANTAVTTIQPVDTTKQPVYYVNTQLCNLGSYNKITSCQDFPISGGQSNVVFKRPVTIEIIVKYKLQLQYQYITIGWQGQDTEFHASKTYPTNPRGGTIINTQKFDKPGNYSVTIGRMGNTIIYFQIK
jgi:hypothetical protein